MGKGTKRFKKRFTRFRRVESKPFEFDANAPINLNFSFASHPENTSFYNEPSYWSSAEPFTPATFGSHSPETYYDISQRYTLESSFRDLSFSEDYVNSSYECVSNESYSDYYSGNRKHFSAFHSSPSENSFFPTPVNSSRNICGYTDFEENNTIFARRGAKRVYNDDVSSNLEHEDSCPIKKHCVGLKINYSQIGLKTALATTTDYSQLNTRVAYLHKYVGNHVTVIQTAIRHFVLNSPFFRRWFLTLPLNLKILCVGGGPGTDLMGFVNSMAEQNMYSNVIGVVLDQWSEWKREFDLMNSKFLNRSYLSSVKFHQFHFYENFEGVVQNDFSLADVVTMIKFISAVMHDKYRCEEQVQEIFCRMKPGAVFIFSDNAAGGSVELIDKIAPMCGMIPVCRLSHHSTVTDGRILEELELNRNCCKTCRPMKISKTTTTVWRKMMW